MYIIRRKSDGRYFGNRPVKWERNTETERFEPANQWVDDPSLCKPFLTKQSASRSRGMHVECPYPLPNWREEDRGNHTLQLIMRRDWFADRTAKKKLKYELYDILKVEVRIKDEQTTEALSTS